MIMLCCALGRRFCFWVLGQVGKIINEIAKRFGPAWNSGLGLEFGFYLVQQVQVDGAEDDDVAQLNFANAVAEQRVLVV